jgi:hypothetical protein
MAAKIEQLMDVVITEKGHEYHYQIPLGPMPLLPDHTIYMTDEATKRRVALTGRKEIIRYFKGRSK